MKKILFSLVLVGGLLQAGTYTRADRIADMNTMAEAMNTIQSGFFYNNYETVEAGVETLSKTIARVKAPEEEVKEEDMIARYMNQKIQVSNKIVKKIRQKSLTILQRFKDGDSAQAAQAYTKVMEQCMKCHREIRNW